MNVIGVSAAQTGWLRRATAPSAFTKSHKWDHNFFALMVALIWLGILMGFVPEILHRAATHQPAFPTIVHIHAVVFVTFLCVLTAQVLLVRVGRTDIHRKLGIVGAGLYGVMIVLGLAVSVIIDRILFATPQADPSFISIQLADILSFAVLGGAALALRKTPQAHKRLMIIAVICIADAGFSRWWADGLHHLLGHGPETLADGYWVNWAEAYLSDFLLIAMLGFYDLITRRRLHPAYVFGAIWGLGFELIAIGLYVSPWWKPVATALIGR